MNLFVSWPFSDMKILFDRAWSRIARLGDALVRTILIITLHESCQHFPIFECAMSSKGHAQTKVHSMSDSQTGDEALTWIAERIQSGKGKSRAHSKPPL